MAKKVEYKSKGILFNDEMAKVYGKELERMKKQGRSITPDNVVNHAKKQDSPLHDFFQWNNTVAGNEYRKQQARLLIDQILIVYPKMENKWVRAFVSIQPEQEEGEDKIKRNYMPIADVVSNKKYRQQMVGNALMEARRWHDKFEIYSELQPIFDAIEDLSEELEDDED